MPSHFRIPKSTRSRLGVVLTLSLLGSAGVSHGHALLTYPQPRDNLDTHKDPNGPCGVAKTNSPTTMRAGSMVNVTWTETIDHQGCFIFDVSTDNDVTWQQLAVAKHQTVPNTPRPYSAQIQIPSNVTCSNCTFRMRQIMYGLDTDPCPPASIPAGATYYSCADVTLTADNPPPDMASDAATPPPTDPAPTMSLGCQTMPGTHRSAPLLGFWLVLLAPLLRRRSRA